MKSAETSSHESGDRATFPHIANPVQLNAALRVLYISGANPDEKLRADLEAAQRAFLAKPFRTSELRRKAKELLSVEPAAAWVPAVSRGES